MTALPRRLQCFAVVDIRRPGVPYTVVTVCKRFRWHLGPCDNGRTEAE